MKMQLRVNGTPMEVEANVSVTQLLTQLELLGKRVAVEINGQIVPKSQHHNTPISHNDKIEIVVAVGGG